MVSTLARCLSVLLIIAPIALSQASSHESSGKEDSKRSQGERVKKVLALVNEIIKETQEFKKANDECPATD